MSRRFIITGIVLAALLGGLGYFQFVFKPQMIRTFLSTMKPPPATVTAEAARTEQWIERLTSIGTLIASQGVDVTSQVAGIVTDVHVESGSEVDQGTKLVQLDTSVEVADLASAIATQREAEVAYARQVDLMQKKVTSEANLDTARAKQETTLAAVNRIQAVIAQKAVAAPFSGRAGIRKVEKGQYVSAGMALVSLQALDPIRADFPMPEQHIGKLRVGQPIELTVDAYPGQVFKGEIQSLDARVAQDTRTLLVRAILPNKERKLLPGMFANVTVLVGPGCRYRHRSPDRHHLQPVRRQRLRGEAGADRGAGRRHRRRERLRPASSWWPSAASCAPARCARTASPSPSALPPASRSSPPASSSSIPGRRSASTTRSPSPRPKPGRSCSCRAQQCRSPISSSAARCSPPS